MTRPWVPRMRRAVVLALGYAAIVDADSFMPIERVAGAALLIVAAKVGATRLIDNARMVVGDGASRDPARERPAKETAVRG